MKLELSVGGLMVALAITSLNAGVAFTNPLGSNFKSTDNGGTLPAIDAYKDGVGVMVLDNIGAGFQIDNSAMNTLVYKYGETAKNNNIALDVLVLNTAEATNKDKEMAGSITNIVRGNVSNAPTKVDGTACDDGNAATVGEKWLNGECQGGMTGVNITSSGLIYDNCEYPSYSKKGDGWLYCNSKGMRMPELFETTAGGGDVPSCSSVKTWTNTMENPFLYQGYTWTNNTTFVQHVNDTGAMTRCVK